MTVRRKKARGFSKNLMGHAPGAERRPVFAPFCLFSRAGRPIRAQPGGAELQRNAAEQHFLGAD
jgi:hypothetical protein